MLPRPICMIPGPTAARTCRPTLERGSKADQIKVAERVLAAQACLARLAAMQPQARATLTSLLARCHHVKAAGVVTKGDERGPEGC